MTHIGHTRNTPTMERVDRMNWTGSSCRPRACSASCSARLQIGSFRRPLSSRRGEALWEREAAGSGSPWGSPGVVSSESAAGFCGLRGLGRLLGSGLVAPVWVSGVWRAVVECLVHVRAFVGRDGYVRDGC